VVLLSLQEVSCRRSSRSKTSDEVLSGVSLNVAEGELVALVGRSGGGKSTLLRLMNRLEEPSAGTILFRDMQLSTYPLDRLRRAVVLLSQRPIMFPGSVRDNILWGERYLRQAASQETELRLHDTLAMSQLPESLLDHPAGELSVGQQQRVATARALMVNPQVLLADEPTSALDRPTAQSIGGMLRAFSRRPGCGAVMVSHDLDLAAHVADRLVFLEGGRVMEEGPPRILMNAPRSQSLRDFLKRVDAHD